MAASRGVRRSSAGAGRAARPARLEQVRVLAHPLRLQLFELFARGPRTTMQAAAELGQPPTRLYHHVAALVRVGLLRLRETKPNRGTIEKYYEVASQSFTSDRPEAAAAARSGRRRGTTKPGAGVADQAALGTLVLDRAREEFVHAMGALGSLGEECDPNELPLLARVLVGATAAKRAKVRVEVLRFLRRVAAIGRSSPPGEAKAAWSVTVAMMPALMGGAPADGGSPGPSRAAKPRAGRARRRGRAARSR